MRKRPDFRNGSPAKGVRHVINSPNQTLFFFSTSSLKIFRRRLSQRAQIIVPPTNTLKWSESHSVVSDSLWPHRLYSPWNSPGHNIGVGSYSLLQGIFPTEGLDPGLQHCRHILHLPSHQRSPGILEWVAYPFPRGSSQPRIKLGFPALQADSSPAEPPEEPLEVLIKSIVIHIKH